MARKIKVLEVVADLKLGGIERAMQEFALNIDKSKFDVIVATYDDTGPRKKFLVEGGIRVIKTSTEGLTNLVKELKVDIVHSHTIHVKKFIGDVKNVQEVVFSGGYALDADINLFISKALALKTTTCVNIKHGKDFLILYYPQNVSSWDKHRLPGAKIRAIRQSLGIKDSELVVGRIGRSEPSKTDYLVLASAGKIAKKHPNVKFLFAGMPLLFRLWLSLKPSLRGKLIFIPETPDDAKISRFYQSIDIFWHTASRGETFGNVNAEAMIFQKPVITHSTHFRGGNIDETMDNAQIEIVDHMKTGLVASYPSDVVQAVKLLQDKSKRQAMGRAGRLKVVKEYESRKIASDFENICRQLLGNKAFKQTSSDFLRREYDARLRNTLNTSSSFDKVIYSLRKSCFKIIEIPYLVKRILLRKVFKFDIEKLGYNKSLEEKAYIK
jgi:glycosyltransferase involved in cell wall biosynthesis